MTQNYYWRLNKRPEGDDVAGALSLETEAMPEIADGQILVKSAYLSMDAGTRMWMTEREDGYQPPLELGTKMVGLVLGYIVRSRHADFAEGDLVRGFGQWARYSVIEPELAGLVKVDGGISDIKQHFGVLGFNGWTALWGIQETAGVKAGDNVLVSAAAGATGVLACQIAKILGANVYGLAGGPDKCRWLENDLGLTRAIDYKNDDIAQELAKVDGGINAYFDNVGGPILDAVLPNMALYGRIALCGLLAQYSGDGRGQGPVNFDQILMKRLRVEGFFSPDFMDQGERLSVQLKDWLEQGLIDTPFDVTEGIENVLSAYDKLFSGGNIGKVLVKL
ncbi:NADP-dependent oxidoreductase [Parasphingorhabdus sp. JC815]|uniref:NADP-dependent oxidoreductase n=1 Tax=Parasphingorhabdus sp. JC815 TaxID=3232140 RepID=UPI00345ABE00